MYKKITAIFVLLLLNDPSNAQSSSTLFGARSHGLGNTSACLGDEWSLFNNVGGLSEIKKASVSISYHARPQLEGANRMAASVAVPLRRGTAAIGTYRMGGDIFNEQIISSGFSNKLGLASIGIKANYIQYNAEGFGAKRLLSVSMGGIASITPDFKIGAHITNINQARISEKSDERLPAILTAGFSFSPSRQMYIAAEVEKDLDHQATLKAGAEYQPLKKILIRSGVNLYPNIFFFGFGFIGSQIKINYALEHSLPAGVGHQASVCYQFRAE